MPRKKTNKEFINELAIKNPDIELLEEYINNKTKIKVKCKKCQYEWNVIPHDLIHGHGCPKCANKENGIQKTKTNEEFVKELSVKNPDVEPLEKYISAHTKIRVKCLRCNYIWSATPNKLLRDRGCPKCAGTMKKTHEEFVEALEKRFPQKFDVLDKYVNNRTKLRVKCKDCNYEWLVRPEVLLKSKGCIKCVAKGEEELSLKTNEDFIKALNIKNPSIEILEDYMNITAKIKSKCRICDYEWRAHPRDLLKGKRCPKCSINEKKSNEEFIRELEGRWPGRFEPLEKYDGNKTKIKIKCLKCGYINNITPDNILRNGGCPSCSGNLKKNTNEYKKAVETKFPGKFKILGKYINSSKKIETQCLKCGNIWSVAPRDLLSATYGCPICAGSTKKTTEEFTAQLETVHPGRFKVLGEYKGAQKKIKLQCLVCGDIFESEPLNLLQGHSCPKCSNCKRRTTQSYKEEVEALWPGKYEIIGEYIDTHTSIKVRCPVCGFERTTDPKSLIKGLDCPKCIGRAQKTTEEFKKELEEKYPGKYEILGEYITANDKIKVRCLRCNNTWSSKPSRLLLGGGCPRCKESHGEKTITTILDRNNIEYIPQYITKECKYEKPLRFDFAIFRDSELSLIIEYDGEIHFKAINYFGGEEHLKKVKKRDSIKNDYCKANNIPLLRVPYTQKDRIEEIVVGKLKELKLIS